MELQSLDASLLAALRAMHHAARDYRDAMAQGAMRRYNTGMELDAALESVRLLLQSPPVRGARSHGHERSSVTSQ